MSSLPISSPYRSTPDVAVSDAEREQLGSRLNDAYTDGKLEQDDYRTRLDILFQAQKLGELVPVVEGLPALQTYDSPAIVAGTGGRPGEVSEARNGNRLTLLVVGGVAGLVLILALLLIIIA